MLTFAFMHPPYLVRILFGMPSLHLFTFLMFLSLVSNKITTVPRLFSEHFLQNENKHQIMNVHTKWNCLILVALETDSISPNITC